VAKVFDRAASGYDEWYSQPKGRQVFEAESRAVESMIPHEGIGLEIGAGTGVFAEEFTAMGRTVICLDLSQGMLTKAKKSGLHTVLGSATGLPLRSGCLDFAYLITVIEFLKDPTAVFKETKKALKPGAPIVTLFINRYSSWGKLYLKMVKNKDPVFSQAQIYNEEAVEKMLIGEGFQIAGAVGTLMLGPFELGEEEISSHRKKSGVIVVKGYPVF
jgi:ubiquinone/menaquinone biosynthesis C-methylase UbiE